MTKAVTDAGEIAADLFVTPNTLKTPSTGDLSQARRRIPGRSGDPRVKAA